MSFHTSAHEAIRDATVRQGRWLEYFTVGWNLLEAAVGIGAGLLAGSIALIGFGIDSLIETSSGAILLWRLREGEGTGGGEIAASSASDGLLAITMRPLIAFIEIDKPI